MSDLRPETVQDLWGHARALIEIALRDADHAAARRALVTVAVAGSGGDAEGYRDLVGAVSAAMRRLAFADPQPLFDAAAALVAHEDLVARREIVLAPTHEPPKSIRFPTV